MLAAKPGDLSLIPGTDRGEGKNRGSGRLSSDLHLCRCTLLYSTSPPKKEKKQTVEVSHSKSLATLLTTNAGRERGKNLGGLGGGVVLSTQCRLTQGKEPVQNTTCAAVSLWLFSSQHTASEGPCSVSHSGSHTVE